MPTLKEFDKKYLDSLTATFDQLKKSYQDINLNYQFDLTKTEITEAILERLKMYYVTQGKIKAFLDKRYSAAASDYFVESVLFFLKLYFLSQGGQLEAHSEKQIKKTKNSIRPDISVWRQDEVIAIIECKTQLGWNRDNWEQQNIERDLKLRNDYPNAQSYLLVMTGLNWGGFENHVHLNNKYFCLLNDTWPTDYSTSKQIMTPIEGLFNQISGNSEQNN
jgi:hypothetical protein